MYEKGGASLGVLTHPAPQCLKSLQGSIPLEEIFKNLCINITQLTFCVCFLLELILFAELPLILAYFLARRESVLRLS
jgi:hypothetical protein